MSSLKQILFGERAAGVYLKTEIYDPDIDGSDITSSGKIVPAIGSLIIDITEGRQVQQYTVVAVDQTTYKVTMVPSTYVVDSTTQTDRVLSYGNDLFFLYFNSVTVSSNPYTIEAVETDAILQYKRESGKINVTLNTVIAPGFVQQGSIAAQTFDNYLNVMNNRYKVNIPRSVNTVHDVVNSIWAQLLAKHPRINMTRLIVDNKLSLFGNHAAQYQLFRTNSEGNEEVISRWYVNNKYVGTVCDMLDTGVKGIRKCDGCYTDVDDLREGDVVTLKVYSAGGLMIAAIQLIAKQAYLLNEEASLANPIVGMFIDANQIDRDGNLYLYQNQNPTELAIFVMLRYSDGTIKRVAVDNKRGFAYGIEQIDTSVVGEETDIVVKYYLSNEDALGESTSQIASRMIIEKYQQLVNSVDVTVNTVVNDNPELDYHRKLAEFINLTFGIAITGTQETVGDYIDFVVNYITNQEESSVVNDETLRYLSEYVTVKNISSEQELISKVSPIPMWNANTTSWSLKYIRYRLDRTASSISTVTTTGFSGTQFGVRQTINLSTPQVINGIESTFTQSFIIDVRNKNVAASAINGLNWLIKDDESSQVVYGDDTGNHIRPVIHYTTTNGYFIPASIFAANSNQTAIEVFIENFYTQANPPKLATESIAPTPTHFIVKDPSSNKSLMSEMRPIGSFSENLMLNIDSDTPNKYVNDTLFIEFYRYDETTDITEVLYGVPVDVVQGY